MRWRGRRAATEGRCREERPGGRAPPPGTLVAAVVLAAVGCAKEEPPPGAAPDQEPPRITSFRPAAGSVAPDFDDGFRVRFDEPIRENRGLARAMTASPAYRYGISFGFSTFEVRPEGGWRPAVYRFRFPPPFSDLLGNRTQDTVTVTFSTGPPVTETRVAGRLRDRVTGEPVQGGRAVFLSAGGDSIPYTAVAGSEGTFRLPSVPPDSYVAYGFEDLNANLSPDPLLEPSDSSRFVLVGASDSVFLDLLLLEPDTTPPILVSAAALDSARVRLRFDDPLDPDAGLADVSVAITAAGSDDTLPVGEVVLARDTAAVVPDTGTVPPDTSGLGPDTTGIGDSLAETGDTLAVPGNETTDPADTATVADSLALPDTLVVVTVERAFEGGTRYRVSARGFRNLQHLAGGGDTTFVWEPPGDTVPPADSMPAARPDTAAVLPDTAAPPPDTATVARDTAARPRDEP